MSVGYSGTPLPKKLGLKDGQRAAFIGLPESLSWLTKSADFRETWVESVLTDDMPFCLDVAHLSTTEADWLAQALGAIRERIAPNGMIWVSWPKKSAKVPTDVTEDVIRAMALRQDLVDVKVCALDETWSGLKLVIPRTLR